MPGQWWRAIDAVVTDIDHVESCSHVRRHSARIPDGKCCTMSLCDVKSVEQEQSAMKQIWFRFGGRSKPMEVGRGVEEEMEENERTTWRILDETQVYLLAEGRTLDWTDVTRLEDGRTVEVVCAVKGAGDKKWKKGKKDKNLCNFSEERSSGDVVMSKE